MNMLSSSFLFPFVFLLIIHQFVQLEVSEDIKSGRRHNLHDNIYSQYR